MELTPLDQQLQEIALKDWQKFVAMIGEDAVIAAKVCLLRQNRNSYGQISIRLSITERQAAYACKQCDNPAMASSVSTPIIRNPKPKIVKSTT